MKLTRNHSRLTEIFKNARVPDIFEFHGEYLVDMLTVLPSLKNFSHRKIFLTENLCLNIELRDWINFRTDETTNNFQVGLSLGFRFNLSPRKTTKDETAEKVKKYLE